MVGFFFLLLFVALGENIGFYFNQMKNRMLLSGSLPPLL